MLKLKKFLAKLTLHDYKYLRSMDYKVGNAESFRTTHQFKCTKCERYYHRNTNIEDISTYIPFFDKFGCEGVDSVNH
jgi:hypothetical protein